MRVPMGETHATFRGLNSCPRVLPEAVTLGGGEEVTSSLAELKADLLHPRILGISEMALSLPDTWRVI